MKIVFCSKAHKKFEALEKKDQYDESLRIGNIRKKHTNGVLEIKSWYETAKVEKELKEILI